MRVVTQTKSERKHKHHRMKSSLVMGGDDMGSLESRIASEQSLEQDASFFTGDPKEAHPVCSLGVRCALQFLFVCVLACLCSGALFPIKLLGMWLLEAVDSPGLLLVLAPVLLLCYLLCILVIVVLLKWLLVGRLKPGVYPVWSLYFIRWWCVSRLYMLAQFWVVRLLKDTVFINWYFKALGADIAKVLPFRSRSCSLQSC